MRILVTGGGGFLGRNLVRLLALDAGNEIVVVSRSPVQQVARDYAGNTPNVRYVDGVDIESQSCISGHVNGVETVYHLAARIEFDTRSLQRDFDTNVIGTLNVLRCCEDAGVKTLVIVSSIASMGYTDDGSPVTEDFRFDWDARPHNVYMRTKWFADQAVLAAPTKNTRVVIANPTVIVGPGATGNIFKLFKYAATAPLILGPTGKVNIADVRDVAAGLIHLSVHGKHKERYIVGGDEHANFYDLLKLIVQALGKHTPVLPLPKLMATLLCPVLQLLEAGGMNFEAKKTTSKHLAISFQDIFASNAKMRATGWAPAGGIRKTVTESVAWYKDAKLL